MCWLIVLICFFLFCSPVTAADVDGKMKDEIYERGEYIDSLPDTLLSDEEIESGDVTLERMADIAIGVLTGSFNDAMQVMPGFLLIIILGAICSEFAALPTLGEMRPSADAVVNTVIFLYMLNILISLYDSVNTAIGQLSTYGVTLSTVMSSFLTFGGSYTSAGVMTSFTVIMFSVLSCLAKYVFPCVCAIIFVSSLSSVGSSDRLNNASRLITNTYMTVSAFVLSLMSLFVSFQSKAAVSADSVIRRGAKLASAYAIPVVGGAISESLDNIVGGFNMLKTAFGLGAASAVILCVLPSLVTVLIYRLMFSLFGVFSGIAGVTSVGRILSGIDSFFSVLLITVALNAISYLYCLILFCSVEASI